MLRGTKQVNCGAEIRPKLPDCPVDHILHHATTETFKQRKAKTNTPTNNNNQKTPQYLQEIPMHVCQARFLPLDKSGKTTATPGELEFRG